MSREIKLVDEIKKLINELNEHKSEADRMAEVNYKCGHYGIGGLYKERSMAYDFSIQKLTNITTSSTPEQSGGID